MVFGAGRWQLICKPRSIYMYTYMYAPLKGEIYRETGK